MDDKSAQNHASRGDDRPVPRRSVKHARYGDRPEQPVPGAPQDKTFSEQADAEATGDARPKKN